MTPRAHSYERSHRTARDARAFSGGHAYPRIQPMEQPSLLAKIFGRNAR